MNNTNQIIDLIASGKLLEAVKLTINLTKVDNKDDYLNAVIISRELHGLENAIQIGRVNWEIENTIKNNLALRILKITEKLNENIN